MCLQKITQQARTLPNFLESNSSLPLDRQRLLVWEKVVEIVNQLQESVTWLDTWQPLIDGKLKSLRFQVPNEEVLASEVDAFIVLMENIWKDTAVRDISRGSNTIQ